MASVHSSRSKKYFEDEPLDHLESAGEILIKQLVKKQTNTSITLDDYLRCEKKFEQGIGCVTLDQIGSGSISLEEFEIKKQQVERVCELEGRGLNRQEAVSLVENVLRRKATPEVKSSLQHFLEDNKSQLVSSSYQKKVQVGKRQEQELALCVKPNSIETRLYHFAVSNERGHSNNSHPLDHPIHQLAEIEKSLVASADPIATARTIRRKRRQQLEAEADPPYVHFNPPEQGHSLWDSLEKPCTISKKPCKLVKDITCSRKTLYTVKDGKILKLDQNHGQEQSKWSPIESKPTGHAFVSVSKSGNTASTYNQISEDDIKSIPKFQNYERGEESKILYIKNLASDVTECDLADLFCQFEDPANDKIVYRLLTGKMRRQAFVTFNTCADATKALEAINGTIFKGRPVIIQYGKRQ